MGSVGVKNWESNGNFGSAEWVSFRPEFPETLRAWCSMSTCTE